MQYAHLQARCLVRPTHQHETGVPSLDPQLPSTAIHLHQHQSLWAATNAFNSPVHIAPHERISGGMCLHTLADCGRSSAVWSALRVGIELGQLQRSIRSLMVEVRTVEVNAHLGRPLYLIISLCSTM